MRSTMTRRTMAAAAAVLGMLAAGRAEAGVVLTATESRGNVIISGGGTINLVGLTDDGKFAKSLDIVPTEAALSEGLTGSTASTSFEGYSGVRGPASFGKGTGTYASSGSGDFIALYAQLNVIGVPIGYTSGTVLTVTDTYAYNTFNSLGLTVGTYTYTLTNGDTITLQVGPAAVSTPEPATLAQAGAGLLATAGFVGWRRRRRIAG